MADSLAEPLRGIRPQSNKVLRTLKRVLATLPDHTVPRTLLIPSLAQIVEARYTSPKIPIAKQYEDALLRVLPEERESTLMGLLGKIETDLEGLEQLQALAKVQNARSTLVDLSLRLVDDQYIPLTTPRALVKVRETVNYLSRKLDDKSPSAMVNFHEITLQQLENMTQKVSDPETRRLIEDKLLSYLKTSPPELLRNYARKICNAISRG